MFRFSFTSFALTLLCLASCGPSRDETLCGPDGEPFQSSGIFTALGSNVLPGSTWQLNRPIRIEFNHPVDPDSIGFGTIQIRSTDDFYSGNPVTGTFELEANSANRAVIFRPSCPTDDALSNGGFLPGNVGYELVLPSKEESPTVLRDTAGRALSRGMQVSFQTPSLSQSLFLDFNPNPASVTSVVFPDGLNLYTDPNPILSMRFDQAVDGRSSNLNTQNLKLLFADGEVGSTSEDVFPETNRIPGQLRLIENCTDAGALVEFHITGILPVNRKLQLTMGSQFRDLGGQRNNSQVVIGIHATPSLAAYYQDPSYSSGELAVDEFQDLFDQAHRIDLSEPLPLPIAQIQDGFIAASFDFPGAAVSEDQDFFLGSDEAAEILTNSQSVFTDTRGRSHILQSGVLTVHDFTIESGATLRGRGANPLIIYATGEVTISGTLDVRGNNATVPVSLQSPQFVESGAIGECGGGRGGDGSAVGNAETLRGSSGDGPFGLTGTGGRGGEGGFNSDSFATGYLGLNSSVVGGGGGGGFSRTENVAVLWEAWSVLQAWVPTGVDTAGPDHDISKHTQMVSGIGAGPNGNGIYGAEAGMRGPSGVGPDLFALGTTSACFGMEDATLDSAEDAISSKDHLNYDPAWTVGDTPPFDFGDITAGPDGGEAGSSAFRNEPNGLGTTNDFWGARFMSDGSVVRGELQGPWAGSGGGAGGDSMMIRIVDITGNGVPEPLSRLYPVVPFQRSLGQGQQGWSYYRKGAGGGGGGGQCLIMAVGIVRIGASGTILANGGIGMAGESILYTDNAISGSGGGSGGHVVIHSATGLDLSAIDLGVADTAAEIGNLIPVQNIQAFGGRRGWAGPEYSTVPGSIPVRDDGNGTFAVGRGGAGANGVIQIHVPDPQRDILWHPSSRRGILDYLAQSPTGIAIDRVEEIFGLLTAPQAYALVPFFSSRSMVVSEWIDTGFADLRLGDPETFPQYGNAYLGFQGIERTTGLVERSNSNTVAALAEIATGSTAQASFDNFQVSIPSASTSFEAKFLRLPQLLVGYDLFPDAESVISFEIADAHYNRSADSLVLTTSIADGPMVFALNADQPTWSVRERFFRVDTFGAKNRLPESASIRFEFQGTHETSPGSNVAGHPFDDPLQANTWVSDVSLLDGYRFLRYRVTFDTDVNREGVDLSAPLPSVSYLKIPLVW